MKVQKTLIWSPTTNRGKYQNAPKSQKAISRWCLRIFRARKSRRRNATSCATSSTPCTSPSTAKTWRSFSRMIHFSRLKPTTWLKMHLNRSRTLLMQRICRRSSQSRSDSRWLRIYRHSLNCWKVVRSGLRQPKIGHIPPLYQGISKFPKWWAGTETSTISKSSNF